MVNECHVSILGINLVLISAGVKFCVSIWALSSAQIVALLGFQPPLPRATIAIGACGNLRFDAISLGT
jgi:hypothetical protein